MIHFGDIEIVELPIIIGDNPSTIGVPITVDWWFSSEDDDEDHQGMEEDADQTNAADATTSTPRTESQSDRIHLISHPIPNEYKHVISLDLYENERPPRRSRKQLHWSRQAREQM